MLLSFWPGAVYGAASRYQNVKTSHFDLYHDIDLPITCFRIETVGMCLIVVLFRTH